MWKLSWNGAEKTAENTVQHRGGSGGSMVANHRGGGESSMVVTTLLLYSKIYSSVVKVSETTTKKVSQSLSITES